MQSPLAPLGVEERWPCRILAVHVSSSCTASSARTLVHVAQTVPQVRAVPNVKREVFGTLTGIVSGAAGHNRGEWWRPHSSQGHKAGALARRLSGAGGPRLLAKGHDADEAFSSHETQCLAPGRAKSQLTRDASYWCPYQRRCGNAGTVTLSHKRAPPARATNPQTGGRLTTTGQVRSPL